MMDAAAPPHVARLAIADPLSIPELARRLRHTHFVWDEYVGGKRRVDLSPLVLSRSAHEDARDAALDVCAAIAETARLAFATDEEASRYAFSPELLALARASHRAGDDARLVRVDLLLGEDDRFRACEINADCPGGLNEAQGLPDLLKRAGYTGKVDVTHVVDVLASRLVALSGGKGSPRGTIAIVFATAYAEDLQLCALVERAIVAGGGRAVRSPPTALSVEDGHCVAFGRRVSVLYRFYPSEHFASLPVASALVPLIEAGTLTTMSSFSCMFEQSKLAFARAHALVPSLSDRVARTVAERIPETVLPEAANLLEDREGWVLKRALGRVGDEVFVGLLEPEAEWTRLVDGVRRASLLGEPWIAQRFVRQRTIATPWGPRFVTLGVYVCDGEFCGYFARLTEVSHTSHDALVVPVVVAGAREAFRGPLEVVS